MTGVGAHDDVRRGGAVLVASLGLALSLAAGVRSDAQVPGPNVDVIGGPTFLTLDAGKKLVEISGDPWRNQQVEPHCAVSSRNPAVILCGAVDYRLVDLPGGADGIHNDSWNMVAQSVDGGVTWASTLHRGHPLDRTRGALGSYDFAADPVVRAGAAGLFYYAGLVADRPTGPLSPPSALYVSTWIHLNDREDDPMPVKMVQNGIAEIFKGSSGQFRDRPDLAVGEPRGGTCTVQVEVPRPGDAGGETVQTIAQTIPATPAYFAFTTFTGTGAQTVSRIQFTKSVDCGRTWTAALKLSEENVVNQAPQVVKVPGSSRILVFWRRGALLNAPDAIMVVRSEDDGTTFTKPRVLATICPFDQLTSPTTFRSRTVPSAAADKDRAYVVWADRRNASGKCSTGGVLNDARALIVTTTDGTAGTTTAPAEVDPVLGRGHQILPSVAVSAGRVHVSWLDFRYDASGVFGEYVDETPVVEGTGERNRHTADIRAAEAASAKRPQFPPSHQVSQYVFGRPSENPELQQLQWNVVNARNFDRMTVAFNGDYNATAAEGVIPLDPLGRPGAWAVNGAPGSPPMTAVFHRFWTDGRNMTLLPEENYYQSRPYTPPDLDTAIVGEQLPATSLFDPTQTRTICNPDETGTKNLEIYTSRSTHGFYAFAPWNNKTLLGLEEQPGGQPPRVVPVQRAFPIVVQNTLPPPDSGEVPRTVFRLTIQGPAPLGTADAIPEMASFRQFSVQRDGRVTPPAPLLEERVAVRAGSAVVRTVYVTSSDPRAAVRVNVLNESTQETRAVFLNPDATAPPNLEKPGTDDGTKPSFDISRYEVHDLVISDLKVQDIGLDPGQVPRVADQGPEDGTPGWRNPGWRNPGWRNPGWRNPGWRNPGWRNPGWRNPGWRNPGWRNPAVSDETAGGSRQISAAYTNTGNTTSSYDARLLVTAPSSDYEYQLIVYKLYTTVPDEGCDASLVGNTQVLVNIPDYDPTAGSQAASSLEANRLARTAASASPAAAATEVTPADTSFSLEPGETAYVVLVVTSNRPRTFPTMFDPNTVTFQGAPQAVDTEKLEALPPGAPVPPPDPVVVHVAPLAIATTSLPNASVLLPYGATLQATGGAPPYTWTVAVGSLPGGLGLDPVTGVLSGTATSTGVYALGVEVRDSGNPPQSATRDLALSVHGYAITGTVRWDEASIATVTQRPAAIRASNGTEDFPASRYDPTDGTYSIPVPAGTYDVVVDIDAAAPLDGKHLAGDYRADVRSVVVGEPGGIVTVNPDCGELIHFISPVDTGQVVGAFPPPYPVYSNPVALNWMAVAGAVRYEANVYVARDVPWARLYAQLTRGDIAGPPFSLDLPDNAANEHYELELWAYNSHGVMVGRTMVEYVSGFGSDHRFKVLAPQPTSLLFIDTPGTSVAGQTLSTVRVQALDASAAPITGANLTMALGADPCGASTLSGGSTASTGADGVATFSTLSLDRGGYRYALRASVTGNPAVTAVSGAFNIEGFCTTGSLAGQRVDATATPLPDGTVLIAGGFDGTNYVSDAVVFDPTTGSFTATGSMGMPRAAHAATLLPNGKVLVTGGFAGSPVGILDTAEIYDPTTHTFTAAASMDSVHMMHTATLLPNGKVLIYGPVGGPNPAELYDPSNGTFTVIAPPAWPGASNPTATLLANGKVLFVGGGTNEAWLYDQATGFSPTGSMSVIRQSHTATLLYDGKVLVAGGFDGSQSLASLELYDPSSGTFSPSGAALGTSRSYHAAARLPNGKVLVAGGVSIPSGMPARVAEIYDPVSDQIGHTVLAVALRDRPFAAALANGTVLLAGGSPSSAETYYPVDPPFAIAGFEAAGTMRTPRWDHTAAPLPDGRILVTAGLTLGNAPVATAEVYDAVTSTFAYTGSLGTARWGHTATALPDGRIFVAGGWADVSTCLDSADVYDPVSGAFTPTGPMSVGRCGHTATLLRNGKVLIVGGLGSPGTAELYDAATGTFTATAGPPLAPRARHTATLLPDGKVLISGSDQSGVLASAELYDPATNTFAFTGSMLMRRHSHAASLLPDGRVLVTGGWDGGLVEGSSEIYDPAAGAFSPGPAMSLPRMVHTATTMANGEVLLVGGEGGSGRVLACELYDPVANVFTLTTSSTGHVGHTATPLFGKVLVAGGGGTDALMGTAESYRYGP
jgi:hypothetical protein